MKLYAGAIDGDWFDLPRSQPAPYEVNAWQLSGSRQFAAQRKDWTSANTVMAGDVPGLRLPIDISIEQPAMWPCSVRAVDSETPAEPRSAARDRDQEAAWCSDFGELQKVVARAGGGIEIERALGVAA